MGFLDNILQGKKKNKGQERTLTEEQQEQFNEGWKEVQQQIENKKREKEEALAAEDLTPEKLDGKKRSYHYKDVNIYVTWQYSGHYGKTLSDLGMVRGSAVSLILDPQGDDPECVKVCFDDITIGTMKTNKMRSMVYQWKERALPIMAVANCMGGEYKLLLEIAFYGYAPRKKE